MRPTNFRSLNKKVLTYVALSTIVILVVASLASFVIQYEHSRINTISKLNQLLDTVEDTITVAAYSKNQQIAEDVLKGLLKNDVVHKASILSEGGFNLEKQRNDNENNMKQVFRPIYSLFDIEEIIGYIYLQPSDQYSLQEAKYDTLANIINSFILITLTALVILWVMQKYISNPITQLSNTLTKIQKGEEQQILPLKNNNDDELGQLRVNINNLLAELDAKFNQEQALKDKIKQSNNELAYEREVIENVILKMHASKSFDETQIRKIEQPVEKTSGDIALSAFRPDKSRHVLLGDFTGHGLTAAIGGPIVFDIFYTMTRKNLPMRGIANEVNQQLRNKLPVGLFLGAVFLELSPDSQQVRIWNCGMSDVLIYRNNQLLVRHPSSAMALGIIDQEFTSTSPIDVEKGDKIYLYSDGITEAVNSDEKEFGQDRLEINIIELLQSNREINYLYDSVQGFMGETKQFDDITLLELTC
ncbi:MAG: SpoIIE family protein phosphatase [Methylococcaceae bacterium]